MPPENSSQKDELAYLVKAQNALSTIVMEITDNCMRESIDTEDPRVL